MKKTIIFLAIILVCFLSNGQTYVRGHIRKNGTYVKSHNRSNKDNTNHNNYSTVRNKNPYTKTKGTVARDYSAQAKHYGSGKKINTGKRGGQYYYNSKNKKTYVPKQPITGYPINR